MRRDNGRKTKKLLENQELRLIEIIGRVTIFFPLIAAIFFVLRPSDAVTYATTKYATDHCTQRSVSFMDHGS